MSEHDLARISIDRVDGVQITITNEDDLRDRDGSLTLEDVPDVLSRPGGWIEFPTVVEHEPANEWEENGPEEPARIRIMAAGVVALLIVQKADERASDVTP